MFLNFMSCFLYQPWAQVYAHKTNNMAELDNSQAMTELVRDFISPAAFAQMLSAIDMDYFCGVPDSLLKGQPLPSQRPTPAPLSRINPSSPLKGQPPYQRSTPATLSRVNPSLKGQPQLPFQRPNPVPLSKVNPSSPLKGQPQFSSQRSTPAPLSKVNPSSPLEGQPLSKVSPSPLKGQPHLPSQRSTPAPLSRVNPSPLKGQPHPSRSMPVF